MTRYRWTPEDLALAQQSLDSGKPANKIAKRTGGSGRRAEQQEQIWFVEWCRSQTFMVTDEDGQSFRLSLDRALVGSANGAYLQGDAKQRAIQMNIMKSMGLNVGASDLTLMIPVNGFHGFCLEMKKRRDQFRSSSEAANAVSADQTAFLNNMRRLGYFTGVGFGWVEAARKTCLYLGWEPAERGLT